VDVIITARDGVITAQFSAETAAGKELLDNQLPQLRAALTQQGLQVDRLEVNQHQASSFAFQQQREQARQQGDGRQRQEQQEDQVEFSLEGLLEDSDFAAVGRELGRAAFTGIR
jgi:flagellar hook-length control protein FliK